MTIKLKKINNTIIKCKKCPRLVSFIKKISIQKRKQNKNEKYWGKPVPGFGDNKAKLMILGLAPAAHGGNRTGRVFTGDKSSDFLFECLGKVGISNQSYSVNNKDNLKYFLLIGDLIIKETTKEVLIFCEVNESKTKIKGFSEINRFDWDLNDHKYTVKNKVKIEIEVSL